MTGEGNTMLMSVGNSDIGIYECFFHSRHGMGSENLYGTYIRCLRNTIDF